MVHSKDVLNFVRNLNLSIVADKLGHGSPKSDVILLCVDKLFLGFEGETSVTRVLLPTKLWAMVTPESIAGVSEKMVSVATSSDHLGMLNAGNLDLKCFLIGYLVEATGFVEGFLNGVLVDPAKIGPELLKVNGLSVDSMFVLSNVGDGRGMGEGMVNSPLKNAKFIYPGVMCTVLGGIWSPGGVTRYGRVGVIQNRGVPFMWTSE